MLKANRKTLIITSIVTLLPVLIGILMIFICLTRSVPAQWLVGILLIMVFVTCIYSYWLHAKKDL